MSAPSLTEQVAERLGPDGVFRELYPYIPSLAEPRNCRVEVRALCPFHDDHRPSWCWNLAKGIATCHVCGDGDTSMVRYLAQRTNRRPVAVLDEYCTRLGLARPRSRTLTLPDYATAKALPVEFLKDRFGLTDDAEGLRIPYLDSNGKVIAERVRHRLGAKPRWKGTGTPARRMVYGLHGLAWIGPTGYIFAVEGESDLHTAWYHDLPALALPGANLAHRALAEIVVARRTRTVYMLPDDNGGGRTMLEKFDRALKVVGWTGELLVARLPAKDLSELHTENGQHFETALWASLHRARPAESALAEIQRQCETEDVRMIRIARNVLSLAETNATDKLLLIGVATHTSGDPKRRLELSKSKLALAIGIGRHTLYDHLPMLVERGLLQDDGKGLRLGDGLVR